MPYSVEYIEKEFGLLIHWEGTVLGDEVIRSYHERFSSPERLKKLRYVLTDYSKVSDFDMTPDDIKSIADITNQAAISRSRVYAVAVMPIDIAYGLARMFQAYAVDDDTGWFTFVTRTRKEAEEWLLANLDKNLTFCNPPGK
jgi:hypothetical protein